MLFANKILIPVEFSARSGPAARYAQALAKQCGAEITVLHVVAPPAVGPVPCYSSLAGVPFEWLVRAEAELHRFCQDHLSAPQTHRVVARGNPADEILKYASEQSVDLIVMPTDSQGHCNSVAIGATAARIIVEAKCPVLAVGRDCFIRQEIGKVLCAVELGERSERALAWAGRLAAAYGSDLAVAHRQELEWAAVGAGRGACSEYAGRALSSLNTLQQKAGTSGEMHVITGDSGRSVSSLASELGADVIVVARSGERVSEIGRGILCEASCPVAVVP